MVWHIDPATKQITILSIPRDTLVSMVGKNVTTFGQFNRINSSYDKGADTPGPDDPGQLRDPHQPRGPGGLRGVQGCGERPGRRLPGLQVPGPGRLLGPQHHHHRGASCSTGPRPWPWPAAATTSTTPQHSGSTDPTGDFGRIKRQDAFLKALIDAAKSKYNPLTINAFLGSLPQGIVIDTHLPSTTCSVWPRTSTRSTPQRSRRSPFRPFSTGYVTPWGDVLFVQQPEAQQLLVSVFGNSLTTPSSPTPEHSTDPDATASAVAVRHRRRGHPPPPRHPRRRPPQRDRRHHGTGHDHDHVASTAVVRPRAL